jgi:hypothetical protein
LSIIEAIAANIAKYSWRLFLGVFGAAGVLLLFGNSVFKGSRWEHDWLPVAIAAFALSSFVTLSYLVTYIVGKIANREKKGRIEFVADAYNHYWHKQSDEEMYIQLSGIFTYVEGGEEAFVLKVHLSGTKTRHLDICLPGPNGTTLGYGNLVLRKNMPTRFIIGLYARPLKAKEHEMVEGTLVMSDNLNRKFRIKNVEIPYPPK